MTKATKKFVLTFAKAKTAARRAYREGKLTAQHKRRDRRDCKYVSGTYSCAIGAALPDDVRRRLSRSTINFYPCTNFMAKKYFTIKPSDVFKVEQLQMAYDKWCTSARVDGSHVEERKRCFLDLIGLKK